MGTAVQDQDQPVPSCPGLAVRSSAQKGRHLVCTRAFKAGDCVLKQRPFAAVLNEDALKQRCDACYALSSSLSVCSRSKLARYCSREHQRAAWGGGYAQECAALVAMAPRVPPPTVRLAARALWRAHREADSTQQQQQQQQQQRQRHQAAMHAGAGPAAAAEGGSWADVQGLVHHWGRASEGTKAQYAQVAALVRQYVLHGLPPAARAGLEAASTVGAAGEGAGGGGGDSAAGETDLGGLLGVRSIALLLARLAANAHTICDAELRPIGCGLFPLASMANHSCDPSCVQGFDGPVLQFRALRPLAPGDEVTIAYVELAATRQDRREALWEQYAFDTACSDEGVGAGQQQQGQEQQDHHQQQQQQQLSQPLPLYPLRPPPLAQHSVGLGGGAEGGAQAGASELRACVYGLQHQPPWPCDARDASFTQLLILEGSSSSSSSSSSCGTLTSASGSGSGQGGAGGLGAGGRALQGGVQAHTVRAQAQEDAARSFGGFGGGGSDDDEEEAGTSGSSSTRGGQQQLKQPMSGSRSRSRSSSSTLVVHMWGPWAEGTVAASHAAAGAGGGGGVGAAAGSQAAPGAAAATQPPQPAQACVQLDCWTVAVEVGALEALVVHAERLAGTSARAQALQLLQEGLRRADGLHVPCLPGAAAPCGSGGGHASASTSANATSASSSRVRVALALGPLHALRLRLLAALLRVAVEEGSWDVALQAARHLTPLYTQLYAQASPNLGLHLATHAKLAMLLGHPAEAAQAGRQALAALRITHSGAGAEAGAVCEGVARTLWEAEQERAAQGG